MCEKREKLLEKLRELAACNCFIPNDTTHVDMGGEDLSSFEKHIGETHVFWAWGCSFWVEWQYPHRNHDHHLKRMEDGTILPLDLLSEEELEPFREISG